MFAVVGHMQFDLPVLDSVKNRIKNEFPLLNNYEAPSS